jgi:hypothetical protein
MAILSTIWDIIATIALFGAVGMALGAIGLFYHWHDVVRHEPRIPEHHVVVKMLQLCAEDDDH